MWRGVYFGPGVFSGIRSTFWWEGGNLKRRELHWRQGLFWSRGLFLYRCRSLFRYRGLFRGGWHLESEDVEQADEAARLAAGAEARIHPVDEEVEEESVDVFDEGVALFGGCADVELDVILVSGAGGNHHLRAGW